MQFRNRRPHLRSWLRAEQPADRRKCVQCTSNTVSCEAGPSGSDLSSDTISTECAPGYFLNAEDPVGCSACSNDSSTLTCTSETDALTCAAGYVLNNQQTGGRKCVQCTSNTVSCEAGPSGSDLSSDTISTECAPGYFLNAEDPVGCSACGSDNFRENCDPSMQQCPTITPGLLNSQSRVL